MSVFSITYISWSRTSSKLLLSHVQPLFKHGLIWLYSIQLFTKIFYSDITFIYVFSLPGVGTFCGTLVFIIELVIVATTSSIPESVTASEGFVVVPLHDVSTAGSQLWLLPTTVCKWKAEIKVTQNFWLLFHLFITVWSSSVWKSIDCISLMINLQNILISIWSIREEEPF